MSEPDPKTTLRESREYFARSYEPQNKLAARIGVTPSTVSCWLAGKWRLKPTTLTKPRAFLDVEAKRKVAGDGIEPIEPERDLTIK
jgi:transcriptional regulator with XRE-family HTH domain